MNRRIGYALVGALAAAAMLPVGASALPEVDIPMNASFGETSIPTSLAMSMGMSCNLTDLDFSCYAEEKEALAALEADESVMAAASCTPPMSLYDGTSFTGSSVNIAIQSVWVNLSNVGTGFNNRTSSWKTGCAGGYLADGTGGAGTRIGMAAGGQQATLGSFNNLASSALRCPC